MTAPNNIPLDQVTLDRFKAYRKAHDGWGSLRIVLADGNVKDKHVTQCQEMALKGNDVEGAELANILLTQSKSQRIKLGKRWP
jgi:hypothetical protein